MRFLYPIILSLFALSLTGQPVITPACGTPGPSSAIRLRCAATLNTAEPLYIIDGEIGSRDLLSSVRAEDIKTVYVIRDGDPAMALFGARAQNGVILITTKSGRYAEPDHVLHGANLAPSNWQAYPNQLVRPEERVRYRVNGKRTRAATFRRHRATDILEIRVYRGSSKAKVLRAGRAYVVFDLITW